MKKLLQITLIAILTGCMLSSCMSVDKRRYNSGYYISHTAGKHATKKQNNTISLKTDKIEKAQPKLNVETEQEVKVPEQDHRIAESAIHAANELGNKQYRKQKSAAEKKEGFVYNAYHADKILRIGSYSKLKENIENKMRSSHSADDVLSFFWVVILIILLVYLIGLLFEGFGLGWAIHLILLVALILLILWLLRVV